MNRSNTCCTLGSVLPLLSLLIFSSATARADQHAAQGPSSRVYTEEEAWQLGWPFFYGPFGNFVPAQTGVELVTDLANARLVWESEDNDFGRAKHTTGTFKAPGKLTQHLGPDAPSHPGGWAGPIIAEGKLFGTSFRPSGPVLDVRRYVDPGTEKARLEAEDLVIALDAKTGKTAWKAIEPGGFVWGVGKRHGFQVAPAYFQGKVFSMGTTGRLFAYEAATGKRLWQTPADPRMEEERKKWLADPRGAQAVARYGWQQSLTVAGGVLIVPDNSRLVGRDVDTGEIKWQLDRVISSWATPNVWRHEGREFLLAATVASPGQAGLRLIEPQRGEVLWTVSDLHATHFTLAPSENHVLVNVGSSITTPGNASAPKDEKGNAYYGRLGCYRISPEDAKLVWEFPDKPHYVHPTWFDVAAMRRVLIRDGLVYYASQGPDKEADRRIVIAREDTGEILVDQPRSGGSYIHLIENRLLHAIDWAHGDRASFDWYTADPADFRKLSGPWAPDQPLTTAYTVNMEVPVVAGRIFLRTETGTILCCDLRATAD